MGVRDRLAGLETDFDPDSVPITDADVFDRLDPALAPWWVAQFAPFVPENEGLFTPPQEQAIPLIDEGRNTLVCAPTGSGKTLAAFAAILGRLFEQGRRDALAEGVHCLYVSPLKALANDVERNLARPLSAMADYQERRGNPVEVRQAIRHGDVDDAARRRMLEDPPHVLNTTPETLAILLNAPSFREHLRTVEYVIVDEIHALADSKRGTHLSVSLERLEALAETEPTRIGCSATIEPIDEIADLLVGHRDPGGRPRDCEIVDARFERTVDLKLECPTDDLVRTPRETIRDRFYDRLEELVAAHDTTIVFTNSRSGAERVLKRLREEGYDEENSACHHGSLSRERRQRVEEQLKTGALDVVTTSTSLELGIDMPTVDLVVQVGSPKSVAALLQRVGRAGHQVGETVTGRVFALERDDLVECAAAVERATAGDVDRVSLPENALDVAAQHVFGMAIEGPRPAAGIEAILRRAHPYRTLSEDAYQSLLAYLTGDHEGLTERGVYPKIWRDANDPPGGEHHYEDFPVGAPLIGKRGRLARVIYLQNVGTIPDSFTCRVVTRDEERVVGSLDEAFLDTLDPGDVFVLGGERYAYRYRRGSKVHVDPTDRRPTVPSWYAERLPLSTDLGVDVGDFQRQALEHHEAGGRARLRAWLDGWPIDRNAVRALARLFDEQVRYAGPESLSTDERLAIEVQRDRESRTRRYVVHSTYGRRVNEGLARLLEHRAERETGGDVGVVVADNGVVLSMALNRKLDVAGLLADIDPDAVRDHLRDSLHGSDLLKRHFRIVATRSLMLLKRYKGHEKSASQQQVASETLLSFARSLEDFAPMTETYREILEDTFAVGTIEELLARIQDGSLALAQVTVDSPSPRAFGLATLSASDVVLESDEQRAQLAYHRAVLAAIGETAPERMD